jgi:hypothetical protein
MNALDVSWPCSRCAHPTDQHGYDGVCRQCERHEQLAGACTFGTLYPAAALMPFPDAEFATRVARELELA